VSQFSCGVDLISGTAIFETCRIAWPLLPPIVLRGGATADFIGCELDSGETPVIFASSCVRVELRDCIVCSVGTIGVVARGQSLVQVIRTTVTGCGESEIVVLDEASLQFVNSVVTGNGCDGVGLSTSSQDNVIRATTISNHENGAGIIYLSLRASTVSDCIAGLIVTSQFASDVHQTDFLNVSRTFVGATMSSSVSIACRRR
jgi:hypothetical protein